MDFHKTYMLFIYLCILVYALPDFAAYRVCGVPKTCVTQCPPVGKLCNINTKQKLFTFKTFTFKLANRK